MTVAVRVFLVGAFALLLVGIGLALWRPGAVIGAGGQELGSSLARKLDADGGRCRETQPSTFTCHIVRDLGYGGRDYELRRGGKGCWEASPGTFAKTSRLIAGCAGILDYVWPQDNTQIDDLRY